MSPQSVRSSTVFSIGVFALAATAVLAPLSTATAGTKATTKAKRPATTKTATTKAPPATTPPSTVAATTVAAAPTVRSKKLVVYSGRNERLVKPLLEAFTQETGIELEVRYADSSQLAATLIEEGSRTKADIFFSQDAGALGALAKRNLVADIPAASVAKVPKQFQSADKKWVGVSGRARVFAYDPRQVSNPPDAIDDLLDPKWKGKLGYVPTNASWHSFVTGLRVIRGEDGAKKWLAGFKANSPRTYSGNALALQAVDRGDIAIGLVNHYYLYEASQGDISKLRARNAFAKAGDPGALVNVAGVAIMKDAGNDSAATDFVKFLLNKDAQEYFARITYEYPLISTVKAANELPPLQTLKSPVTDLSDLETIEDSLKVLREVGLL
jgi:iron(III) transport system substrate-binding protein